MWNLNYTHPVVQTQSYIPLGVPWDAHKIFSHQVGKDKTLQVKVVKVHPLENPEGETTEKKLEGACDSPSSDKENASQENQRKEPPPREEESRRESLSEYQDINKSTWK